MLQLEYAEKLKLTPLNIFIAGVALFWLGLIMIAIENEYRWVAQLKTPRYLASSQAREEHKQIIRQSERFGVSPALLLAITKIETAGTFSVSIRPRRKSGKVIGTARGLCQMIKSTAQQYGLIWGENNAHDQAVACARFTRDNIRSLRRSLGRKPEDFEIYMAHFLGLGDARKFLTKADATKVKDAFSGRVLRANKFLLSKGDVAGVKAFYKNRIAKAKNDVQVFITENK